MYDNFFRYVKNLNIIIYARLSKEEYGKSKEDQSKSIKNQIEICHKYIEEEQKIYPNCIFKIVEILKDDGVSGTTFDRTDFNKLVNLIENKNMLYFSSLFKQSYVFIKSISNISLFFLRQEKLYSSYKKYL